METKVNGRVGTSKGLSGAVRGLVGIFDCWQISHSREIFFTSTTSFGQKNLLLRVGISRFGP